ncbi:MAG: phosphotransferase [Parasphingorhabdus sp.]|uniref:phosphotransferase family protein n=1 Tax=Parasphingorhabdus sp. TaxID=2709688 RepID=UPI0032975DFE
MENEIALVVERHFPGARLDTLKRLTGGVSADVYRLDVLLPTGSALKVVLRCHGPTHSGHDAELEFDLLGSLMETGLPVAQPLFVDTSCELLEYPYLLIGFVDGSSTAAQTMADKHIDIMAETLAMVHKTETEAFPVLPPRLNPLPELFDYLPVGPDWQELRDNLSKLENTAFGGTPVLLHGDFWPANLIWQEDRIAAILDWEDAAVGDPLSDVACTCLELRYIYGEKGMLRFQKAYSQYRDVDENRFALWQIYTAAAAQHFMENWGLEPSREDHMRRTATEVIKEATALILRKDWYS